MYYLNKDSKSRWIQEYHINLSIRHIQTYVVMVPQGVSNTITLSTWELLHQRNNIIAANRQKLHQSTVKLRVLRVLNTVNDALRLIYVKIYGKEPRYHWRNLVLRTYFCQSLGPSLYRGFYVRSNPAAKIQTFLLRRIFAFTNIYLFLWRDRFHFWTKAEAYMCFWRKPWRINLNVYFYKVRRRRVDILSTQPVTCSCQEKKHGLSRALNI